ncbi:unnamed protein product [Callosobruchus maculatus]|uniref:Uncharacterized protein n=1 Tax=Callosobruchus maculatus TaxID=64391 RepID=A0A653BPW4_CALMS|nr:unnamed protein product [Callosobruchus maculatus]
MVNGKSGDILWCAASNGCELELWLELWYCGLWKFYDFALLYSWLGRKWKRPFYTLKLAKYYMQQNMPKM